MSKFFLNNEVKLNSGGFVMKVTALKEPNVVVCEWVDNQGQLQSGQFQEETLKLLKDYKGHIQFRTTVTVGSEDSVSTKMRADSVSEVLLVLADIYKDAKKDVVVKIKHI
jgi:uncharacterized protein YodC (DUF2158 family)